jgi:hypothetical protein
MKVAGRAGDAEPHRGIARFRQHRRQQPLGGGAVILAGRLDEGDGAGKRATIAAPERGGERGYVGRGLSHALAS